MGYNWKSATIAATNRCILCIAEKYFILKAKPSLNKWREIFSSYPHRKKHLLQNYQWPGNEKRQHKVRTATKYTSVIPEESGGQASTLSAWNISIVWREFKARSSISMKCSHSWALISIISTYRQTICIYCSMYLALFSLGLYLNNKKCSSCPNCLPNRSESNKNRLLVTQHVSNFCLLRQDRCRSSMVRSMASKNHVCIYLQIGEKKLCSGLHRFQTYLYSINSML